MTTARRTLDLAMSEQQWQATVLDLARTLGWTCLHVSDSRKEVVDRVTGDRKLVGDSEAAGLPDWILIRERVVWVELKTERGKLRPVQYHIIGLLQRAGQEVHVARPSMYDELEQVLRLRAGEP